MYPPTHSEKPLASSSSPSKSRSAWESRKRLLENDPWATEIDARAITCRGCNRRIKLSEKSAYDNYHWLVHKSRCKIITPKNIAPTKRTSRARPTEAHSSFRDPDIFETVEPGPKAKPKTRSQVNTRSRTRKAPAQSTPVSDPFMSTPTPPLTDDDGDESGDEDMIMTSPEQRQRQSLRHLSDSSELSSPPPTPSSVEPVEQLPTHTYGKWVFEIDEYIYRIHGLKQKIPADLLDENWRDWSWTRLHEPKFSIAVAVPPTSMDEF